MDEAYVQALEARKLIEEKFGTDPFFDKNGAVIVGFGLDSETLAVKGLKSHGKNKPWTCIDPEDIEKAESNDIPLLSDWIPDRIMKSGPRVPEEEMTLYTMSATVFRHKKGGYYTGISCGMNGDDFVSVYLSHHDGTWWIRPWDMFADGRFSICHDEIAVHPFPEYKKALP